MEMGGRVMKGWIFVSPDGCADAESLRGWVDQPTDAAKDAWIGRYSDHSLLYCEVQD